MYFCIPNLNVLLKAYGREGVSTIHELNQDDLERKLSLCNQVLNVLDKITPGYNISRGWALYELQAAELTICRRIFEEDNFTISVLRKRLVSAMKILLEAIKIFEFSDSSSVEYLIAQSAKQETLPGL